MNLLRIAMLVALAGIAGLFGAVAQDLQPVEPGKSATSQTTAREVPYLGVIVTENPDQQVQGLVILKRIVDGPAAKAGLQVNDVLLRMDDQILLVREQLGLLIKRHRVGDLITFTYQRPGATAPLESAVTLQAAPSPSSARSLSHADSGAEQALDNPRIAKRTVRLRDKQHAISITTMEGRPFLTVIRLPSHDVEFQGSVTTESMKLLDLDVQQKVQQVAKIEDDSWVFELPPLKPPRQLPPNAGPSSPTPSFGFPKAPPLKKTEKK